MKKRIGILLLVMLLLLNIMPVGATEPMVSAPKAAEIEVYQSSATTFAERSAFETAVAMLEEGVRNMETEINIYAAGLPESQRAAAVQQVKNRNPRFFYLEKGYSYRSSGNTTYSIIFNYNMTASEVTAANRVIDAEVNRALAGVTTSMSDAEKALAIHDYICAQFEYDVTYTNYDIYTFVRDRQGVCEAYTLLYMDILEELGIPCEFVSSNSMVHAWNLVEIDGAWYHVDVTYDDPMYDLLGTATHNYFLLNDATMQDANHNHTGYEANHAATSTTYVNRAWVGMRSPFVNVGGTWYTGGYENYTSNLYTYNFNSDTLTSVYTGTAWSAPSGGIWTNAFMGVFGHKGTVIFNQKDGLYQYDPQSRQTKKIYSVSTQNKAVYGARMTNDTIYYCMTTSPNNGHYNSTAPNDYAVYSVARAEVLPNAPTMYLSASAGATSLSGYVMVSHGDYTGSADLIFAAYDGAERLIGFSAIPLTLNKSSSTQNIPFSVGGAKRVQVFLFESGTITPLAVKAEKTF